MHSFPETTDYTLDIYLLHTRLSIDNVLPRIEAQQDPELRGIVQVQS
jgi:hypothetical protein